MHPFIYPGSRILSFLIIFILMTGVASAQSLQSESPLHTNPIPIGYSEAAKLIAEDSEAGDEFGSSIAINGNRIVVGASHDADRGDQAGSAYVFEQDMTGNWIQIAKLLAQDGAAGDHFGDVVRISGNTIVVTAQYDDEAGNDSGSAYIFEWNVNGNGTWSQVAKLIASDAAPYDQFGISATIEGDLVIIGSCINPPGGILYLFERDQNGPGKWGEITTIRGDDTTFGDAFGISVDISGNKIVAGAYAGGDYDGSAYIFEQQDNPESWVQVAKIAASDRYAYDYFGYASAISGNTVVSGAPGDDGLTGSAYIFRPAPSGIGDWEEVTKLIANDPTMYSYFGLSVDINNNIIAIGAPYNNDQGAVYIYEPTSINPFNWSQTAKLVASKPIIDGGFGAAVGIQAGTIIVGFPGDTPGGSVYVFNRDLFQVFLPLTAR
jgi:FG-GAP repeat